MAKFQDQNPIMGNNVLEERIKRLEEQQAQWGNRFFNTFLTGRLRTDRTTPPASSTDVNDTDRVYDIIRIYPYEYVLINTGTVYEWVRITMSTF